MTENGRRDPYAGLDETLGDLLGAQRAAVGKRKDKHDRSWEREQRAAAEVCQVSYRQMPRTVRDRIKAIAQVHKVTTDQVARRLLEYALERYDAGELQIEARAEVIRLEVTSGGKKRTDSGHDSGHDSG